MFVPRERRIAQRIKDYIKDEEPPAYYYIMLRNGRILNMDGYHEMLSAGKIKPQDAYVYIGIGGTSPKADFYYPFLRWALRWTDDLLNAYLSKLGFHYGFFIVPATGLEYIADAERYKEYLTIEVTNLDTVVSNTNLRNIVVEVLGKKLISGEKKLTDKEYEKILDRFSFQQLFADYYNTNNAWSIIKSYYESEIKPSVKEVARISMDYDRIFNSYKVCYDMKTWKEIDCWSIK